MPTSKARVPLRVCSSALAPLVLIAVLATQHPVRDVARPERIRPHGVSPIRLELPDGLRLTAKRTRKPAPPVSQVSRVPVERALQSLDGVFSGLGAWVDLYDYATLPVGPTIARMRTAGVRTLYMETGTSGTRDAVVPASVPWLIAAHRAGLKVVAWYLPYYVNVAADVTRTVWIAHFHPQGIHFDGIGVDIEYKGAQPNNNRWNANVVAHMRGVRRFLKASYPLAAIVPPPLQMRLAPLTWRGFPWGALGAASSEVMLMNYWSYRTGCPHDKLQCPYDFTKYNVLITRRLIGADVPIHVIGGVADQISHAQLMQFIQAAFDANADGGSIYDSATTAPGWWRSLAGLRGLGM